MGEGAARAIAVVSIILTVASLALALVFARKRSRIRVGFDLARAGVAIGAILVMAAVAQVTTPPAAIVIAVVIGVGLGFAQGSSLDISPGERGFYAQRSPLGIALWGVGIVIMQGAGMASRAGTVRIGQTIAWFSACLGIGLMVGRNGPLEKAKKALAGAGVAALAAVLVAPALIAGMATAAVAQSELTAEDLCAFAPYQTLDLDAGEGLGAEQADLGPATVDGIKFCARMFGGYIEDGQRYNADTVAVYLYPSTAEATAVLDEHARQLAFTTLDIGIGDRYMEIGTLGDLDFLAIGQRGPFIFQIYSWFEVIPARDAMREIDANVAPFVTDTGAVASTTIVPGGGETATTNTDSTQSVTATTEARTGTDRPSPSGDADERIDPEEAAAQAIGGLIAAAAIGLISWAEAAAEIGQILDGTHNTSLLDPKEGDEETDPIDPESVKEEPSEKEHLPEDRADPCAFQLDKFRKALADWQRIQSEISALENEYALTNARIESEAESDFLGASFDVAMLAVDIRRGGQPPTSGVLRSMVNSWGQNWARSVTSQMIQQTAVGQPIDATAVANKAAADATGLPALTGDGNPTSGAFGTFINDTLTKLLAANRNYDYLKFMDTLAEPGAISDPEVMKLIERSSFESFQERIGPWVGVVSKYLDFWHKNQKWGEGVERRATMRSALLTPIRQRIDVLKGQLEYVTIERDGWRRDLAKCREEEGMG